MEKENTIVQEIIQHLDDVQDAGIVLKLPPKGVLVIKTVVLSAKKMIEEEYLPKEKTQLEEYFNAGVEYMVECERGGLQCAETFEEYYNRKH